MRHRTLARLTLLLALCLVLPLAAQGRQHVASQITTSTDAASAGPGRGDDWAFALKPAAGASSRATSKRYTLGAEAKPIDTAPAVYIIQLSDPPLVSYKGGIASIPATSPRLTAARKLNVESQPSRAYKSYLQSKQATVIESIQKILGAPPQIVATYASAYNGIAVRLTQAQAEQVAHLPGVMRIERETISKPQTDTGPIFIGAAGPNFTPSLFKASIAGTNEVPPVTTSGSGSGVFTFDASSNTLSFEITVKNLSGAISLAHIHQGAVGVAGPPAYDIMPKRIAEGVYIGGVVLSSGDVSLLQANGLYVNFHTAANPGGEVRGQIKADKGEGMLVGVIDTGINFTHASFAATGGDGYTVTNPLGNGNYVGVCDPANPIFDAAFTCNSKLIGAWTWPATNSSPDPNGVPSPADDDEHGSHTASTAAGNVVSSSVGGIDTGTVSGVAPHANIIMYDACNTVGGCPGSALVASIDQAVQDGVDVINYSIGGDSRDPWGSADSIAFLNALDAGILASVSAGNDGPDLQTLGAPSNAPWVMSVAASTHNRVFVNNLTNLSGGAAPGPIAGKGFSDALTTTTAIVYAGDAPYNNPLCLTFSPGTDLSGKIVVCDRGQNGRVEKAQNVADAGGAGFVLANNAANGDSLNGDVYPLPGVHITYNDGVTLKAWLATAGAHTGQISGAIKDLSPANGDVMASFSSRGPDLSSPDTLKPDIAAPGVDVLAAVIDSSTPGLNEFGFLSGTSMAAPHNAGALTLLKSLHPTWTPSEIQSALETTAVQSLTGDGGVGPWARGSGRIDVQAAARAGLVLNETAQGFYDADPLAGGRPRDLNRASFADSTCVVSCTWTRRLSNTLGAAATWNASATDGTTITVSVSPGSFTIPAGGTQTITVSANVSGLAVGDYDFGNITLTPAANLASAGVPVAHLPLSVVAAASSLPSEVDIATRSKSGTQPVNNLRAIAISNLKINTYGLVKGQRDMLSVAQDLTPDSPTDVLTQGVIYKPFVVPANTPRFVAEIGETRAKDLDLYVYRDGSGSNPPDGKPSDDENVCASASDGAIEKCDIVHPVAGTYIVLVQNFEASAVAPAGASPTVDTLILSTGIVPPTSAGNLIITGPSSKPAGVPFSLDFKWNIPSLGPDQRWYGAFDLGTSPAQAGNLGFGVVDLVDIDRSIYLPFVSR